MISLFLLFNYFHFVFSLSTLSKAAQRDPQGPTGRDRGPRVRIKTVISFVLLNLADGPEEHLPYKGELQTWTE